MVLMPTIQTTMIVIEMLLSGPLQNGQAWVTVSMPTYLKDFDMVLILNLIATKNI